MATRDPDTPTIEEPDGLEIVTENATARFSSGDAELDELALNALNRMGDVGSDAERRYQEALEPLRERREEIVDAVSESLLRGTPEERYIERWRLTHLLVELRAPRAAATFDDLLQQPIPEELSPETHLFSTRAEELTIRSAAVDGLEALAAGGDEQAREMLLRHLDSEHFTVRRAVVQALRATGDDEMVGRLRDHLEERGEPELFDIVRVDVTEVPQATGGLFRKHAERDEAPPPEPDL